jgi:hypothetical protein
MEQDASYKLQVASCMLYITLNCEQGKRERGTEGWRDGGMEGKSERVKR